MTNLLRGLAGGRVIVALEGGYNLRSISSSMEAVLRVLLGEAPTEKVYIYICMYVYVISGVSR